MTPRISRREFGRLAATGLAALTLGDWTMAEQRAEHDMTIDGDFFIRPHELTLKALHGPPRRALSFKDHAGPPEAWRKACRDKLAELLALAPPAPATAERRRSITRAGVTIEAWVLRVDERLTIPAYLLIPAQKSGAEDRVGRASRPTEQDSQPQAGGRDARPTLAQGASPRDQAPPAGRAVMAIHGHGSAEPCVGLHDDYHHAFALRLAQAGHLVLCPELRGFGALTDMAHGADGYWLDYWGGRDERQFTLVTDGFLYGQTLIGQTIADLLRWEQWLATTRGVRAVDVAGISYGGDLAIMYPVFSERVRSIYTSGSLGSLTAVFAQCYNAPAHCVPGLLQWMDRSDIAGLNAPRPLRVHYGALDTPGPHNASASYNATAEPALAELRAIYAASGAPDAVTLRVTPERGHEMDNDDLIAFLGGSA